MDAPLYRPAQAYEQPHLVPSAFGVDMVAVADLLRSPAIRAMLNEEIPGFDARTSAPVLQPHLTNFTLRDLSGYGMISADVLPRIDARLRDIPESERPSL